MIGPAAPVVSALSVATAWYSGAASASHCTARGKREIGTKMPLKRNIGITSRFIALSKSSILRMNVVRQIAIAENDADT